MSAACTTRYAAGPARPVAFLPLLLLLSIPVGIPVGELWGQTPTNPAGAPDAAPAAPASPEVRAEMRLVAGGRIDLFILVAAGVPVPSALQERIARGDGDLVQGEGEAELAWASISEEEALAVLREGRQADEGFSLRVLMAPGVAFDDIWALQAAFSQAGIRRVQFVTGDP